MLANHNFGDFYANYITRCTSEAEIEDITCPGVRYRVEHEEIKFISTGVHVIFCLYNKSMYGSLVLIFFKFSPHN